MKQGLSCEKRSDPSTSLWAGFLAIQLEFRWIAAPAKRARNDKRILPLLTERATLRRNSIRVNGGHNAWSALTVTDAPKNSHRHG